MIGGTDYVYIDSNRNGGKSYGFEYQPEPLVVIQQQSGKPHVQAWPNNYGFEYTGSGVPQL